MSYDVAKGNVNIPTDKKRQCSKIIHTASAAAAAAGAIPIPMSDTIPITGAQILMIKNLGSVFGLTLNDSLVKSLLAVTTAQQVGRSVATNLLKAIPGVGSIVGGVISASTAAALTEALGWYIADDFYKLITYNKFRKFNFI